MGKAITRSLDARGRVTLDIWTSWVVLPACGIGARALLRRNKYVEDNRTQLKQVRQLCFLRGVARDSVIRHVYPMESLSSTVIGCLDLFTIEASTRLYSQELRQRVGNLPARFKVVNAFLCRMVRIWTERDRFVDYCTHMSATCKGRLACARVRENCSCQGISTISIRYI